MSDEGLMKLDMGESYGPRPDHPDQSYFDLGSEFDCDMYCSIYDHGHEAPSSNCLPQSTSACDNTMTIYSSTKRSRLERWLDRHNHKMELLRTMFGFLTVGLQLVILGKLFDLL